jgi:hypothetical protein
VNGREVRKYRQFVLGLKKLCPADRPIRVRRIQRPKAWGYGTCSQGEDAYYISLRASQTYNELVDTLCHEWAHALAWDDDPLDDHPDEWGIAYARVYRAMLAISADWPPAE